MDPNGEGFDPRNFPEEHRPLGIEAQQNVENGADGQVFHEGEAGVSEGMQHLPEEDTLEK